MENPTIDAVEKISLGITSFTKAVEDILCEYLDVKKVTVGVTSVAWDDPHTINFYVVAPWKQMFVHRDETRVHLIIDNLTQLGTISLDEWRRMSDSLFISMKIQVIPF